MDGQEVGRVVQLLDQPELVSQRLHDIIRQSLGVAPSGALPGELLQRLLRRERRISALLGILIGQLVQREAAAFDDLDRAGQRLGIAGEQAVHLVRRLEISIGMALAPVAELVDGDAVADAGDDILQDAPARLVEQHVVGDDGGTRMDMARLEGSNRRSWSLGRWRRESAI